MAEIGGMCRYRVGFLALGVQVDTENGFPCLVLVYGAPFLDSARNELWVRYYRRRRMAAYNSQRVCQTAQRLDSRIHKVKDRIMVSAAIHLFNNMIPFVLMNSFWFDP